MLERNKHEFPIVVVLEMDRATGMLSCSDVQSNGQYGKELSVDVLTLSSICSNKPQI